MILLSFMASDFLLARAAIVRAVSNGIRDTRFCVLLAFALCPWATSSLFAAVSVTDTSAPHYRANPIMLSVSAEADPSWNYSEELTDCRGNYYTRGTEGIYSFRLHGLNPTLGVVSASQEILAAGGNYPQTISSLPVTYSAPMAAGSWYFYVDVNTFYWVDGRWESRGSYDEEGNWVDEDDEWIPPNSGGTNAFDEAWLPITISNGGSTPQTITWTNAPSSPWAWTNHGPFAMAAACSSGGNVRYSIGPTSGYPWAFSVSGNNLSYCGMVGYNDWIGNTWTVLIEAPASATHAYTSALYPITLGMASQTIPTPVVGPTISNTGYCVLWYLMAPALMEAGDTNGGVAYTLIGGGGEIDWSDIYRPNGYIGNVTIRTRHPGTAFTYPSNDGVITFATAVPTVAPAIQTQPVGASVFVGSTVSLSVSATGQPAPTYQWRKNGVDLAGATATTLTLPNVQVGDSGSYVAVATNSAGTAQSNAASLTVSVPPPTIVTQPSNRTTYAGEAVGLSVVASGAPAPGYQWYRNGVPVVDATGANLIISNPQIADAGSYSVVVANAYGSVTSANVTLTVNPARPPIITSAASITGTINTPLSYHFSTHVPASSYIWDEGNLPDGVGRFGAGELIQGTPSQTGYFVLKFRAWGAVGQGPQFTLTITINGGGPNQIVPTISSQPSDRTVAAGGNTILSVGVSGPGPISYEWRKNGSVVPGEVYSSLFITNVSANHVGEYSVRVANPFGFAVSLPAVVTVTGAGGGNLAGPPAIYRHPQSQAVRPGGNVVLSVDATSALPFTYQWRKGGVALVGQTNADLALLGFTANDADYYDVIVANSAGFVQSDTAALSLDQYAQEIRFLPLPNRAFPVFDATTTITLKAVATSLLPVTFSVVSGPATVTGNILTVTGAGLITVRAHQAGAQNSPTGTYSSASLDREFTVVQGTPPAEPSGAFSMQSDIKRSGTRLFALSVSAPEPVGFDIDRDGYPEEIIPAGVGGFEVLASVDADYTQMILDTAAMAATLQTMWASGVWSPFWLSDFTADSPRVDENIGWVRVANIITLSLTTDYDIFFNLVYRFTPEPGEEYVLFGEYNHRWGDRVENWPADSLRVRRTYRTQDLEGGQTILSIQEPSPQAIEMLSVPYYLIRKGRSGASSVGIPRLYRLPSSALSLSFNRTQLEEKLAELKGRPLTEREIALINMGCVGIARIETQVVQIRIGGGVHEIFVPLIPENNIGSNVRIFGEAKGFRTLAQAQAAPVPVGTRRVIFSKWGRWKNDMPPIDIPPPQGEPGQIPVDSVVSTDPNKDGNWNYVTLINGKWVGMNHAVGQGPNPESPQQGWIYDQPPEPEPTSAYKAVIWVRRDVLDPN